MITAVHRQSIIVGEVFASASPSMVATVLGSCIAACLFDPVEGIGGMNHFMLPQARRATSSASFGIHAMELLINRIMQLGGDRRRLQAKVFGGANVLALRGADLQIGLRNADFVKRFLAEEGIPLVAQRLGGTTGIKACFYTHTGRALVKALPNRALDATLHEEVTYLKRSEELVGHPTSSVTFFE